MHRVIAIAVVLLATAPAAAQVRVIVDGKVHEVPAGVIRTVSYSPGGVQKIVDRPFSGTTVPGAATVTTTETTDEDERGRPLQTRIETRIEPQADYPQPQPTVYVMPTQVQVQPLRPELFPPQQGYVRSEQAGYQQSPPQIGVDPSSLSNQNGGSASDTALPQVLRIHRNPFTGHFIAPVVINGVKLHAIIDTGATYTILSQGDARASRTDQSVIRTEAAVGIGGYTQVGVTRIHSLEIGGRNLGSFVVRIGKEGIPQTLLGQTEIARLGRITIDGDVMTIFPRGVEVASR
jgi:clan AA aspartic protease (TIGR02281 family)